MALLLKSSIFFHVGRTGGYWVRDVLAALELVEGEAGSFHSTPVSVRADKEVLARSFSFCFVRHPLTWLRSAWIHDVSVGWAGSAFPEEARLDCFADYLDILVQLYPQGVASHYFDDFVRSCTFVGRLEAIREDLCLALFRAQERFNVTAIYDHPIQNGSAAPIAEAAVAPLPLLEKMMATEKEFCRRFDYDQIPTRMVSEMRLTVSHIYQPLLGAESQAMSDSPGPSALVTLRDSSITDLRDEFDTGRRIPEVEKELSRRLADFTFANGCYITTRLRIDGRSPRRDTLEILDFISSQDLRDKKVIELGAGDGVFCLFAEARGASKVVARAFSRHQGTEKILSPFLRSKLTFSTGSLYETCVDDLEKYDCVFLFNSLHEARYPMLLLRAAFSLLRPGGIVLIATGVFFDIENLPLLLCPGPSLSPFGPAATSFFNINGLTQTLNAVGFEEIEIRKSSAHGLPKHLPFNKLSFAAPMATGDGRYSPIGRVLLSAKKKGEIQHVTHRGVFDGRELRDKWDCGKPIFFVDVSPCIEESDLKRMLTRSEDRAARLAAEVEALKYAINDREQDLAFERSELALRGREVDEARKELEQARGQLKALTNRLLGGPASPTHHS
jgi:SAM-dependent methyltransferase